MNQAQLISLAKRLLLPKLKQWWRDRKKRKQQQQGGQGGHQGGHQQYQQPQSYQQQGPPGGYGQPPPPSQQYNQGPHGGYNQQQPYGQPQQQSYSHAAGPAVGGGAAAGFYGAAQPQQQPYGGQVYPQQQPYGGQQGYQQQQQQPYRPPQHVNTDMQHASDPHYVGLRNQALKADAAMHSAFDRASQAYDAGDGGRAKQLSNEGHAAQAERDRLNDQAADWIFEANNRGRQRGEIDLHGLYVQEAIEKTEKAVRDGQSQGLPELRVITGKGIHSNQGVAKIKPAIEKLMVKYHLSAHLDPHNSGVLIVNLQGAGGGSRDLGWVDQADRESDEGQCIIS